MSNYEDGIRALKYLAWSDERRGIIALKTNSLRRIELFRQHIRDWRPTDEDEEQLEDMEFESYLIEAIVGQYSLTILLRRNLRRIKIENLAELLFARNKMLKGSLTHIKCKSYTQEDFNQNETSRKDWRLVHLEGDDAFLESIAQFPNDHFFKLGSDGVQVRGGKRVESKRRKPDQTNKATKSGLNAQSISKVLGTASEDVLASEEERERREFERTRKRNGEKSAP